MCNRYSHEHCLGKLTVVFRCDSSLMIGSGHVVRCLTLADKIALAGGTCTFICRDFPGNMIQQIKEHGHSVCRLPSSIDTKQEVSGGPYSTWLGTTWQTDAEECILLLSSLKPDVLIVDHYSLGAEWEKAVSKYPMKIVVIDDLANRKHVCHLLIDQNLGRQETDYKHLLPDAADSLTGPKFAILRSEFCEASTNSIYLRSKRQNIKNILISMGGMNTSGATERVICALSNSSLDPSVHLTVVIGKYAPGKVRIEEAAKKSPFTVSIITDCTNMAELMSYSDLAIGATGGSAWERCCMGLPTLTLTLAENQIPAATHLGSNGAALHMGDISDPEWEEKLVSTISEMSIQRLQSISCKASKLCDGHGASRIVSAIHSLHLSVRKASILDAQDIYDWRYHGDACRFYQDNSKPEYRDHIKWIESALEDDSKELFIATHKDQSIGHIRYDKDSHSDSGFTISICLDPRMRGGGIGKEVLKLALQQKKSPCRIFAVIHEDNIASIKLFNRSGFSFCKKDAHFITMALEASDSHLLRENKWKQYDF